MIAVFDGVWTIIPDATQKFETSESFMAWFIAPQLAKLKESEAQLDGLK